MRQVFKNRAAAIQALKKAPYHKILGLLARGVQGAKQGFAVL